MAENEGKANHGQSGDDSVPNLPPGVKLVRTLRGHTNWIGRIAWSPDGRLLASPSEDRTIRLWDAETGECVRTLKGHMGTVFSVAFDPEGRTLASGSEDKTVKLWEAASGRLLRTLEGHGSYVNCVAFLSDGRSVASKCCDGTIRLWSSDTGACLAMIPEPASEAWPPGLASHPRLPLLATVGSDAGMAKGDRVIHIWELDLAVLLGQPAAPTVTYPSAKVVLVGESNAGKSHLAHRIATGAPPEAAIFWGQLISLSRA